MKIIAGLGYDSRQPINTKASLGQVVCGESGLLRELDARAGFMPSAQSEATRVIIYMAGLAAANNPNRFYHRSFAVDPIACAKTLLRWRDYAISNGWNRHNANLSSGRLKDLVAVEAYLEGLGLGTGERIERLLPRAKLIASAVHEIVLHDPLSCWPHLYQTLFIALKEAGIPLRQQSGELVAGAELESDLGRFQQALIACVQENNQLQIALQGDGSVSVYRVHNQQAAAQYLCARALQSPSHLIIASTSQFQLNASAKELGAGDLGLSTASCKRGPLQLLPLLINTCWSPPSAEDVLEYLTLPEGPHQKLRRKLARQFVDLPGVGNLEWEKTIASHIFERVASDPKMSEASLSCEVVDWLPIGSSGACSNVPKAFVMKLAEQVRAYWKSRLTACEDASNVTFYSAAQSGASILADAIQRWPGESITRIHLEHLLNLVADASALGIGTERTVSTLNVVTDYSVARLCEAFPETVYWWGVQENTPVMDPPFTANEFACLPWALNDTTRAARDRNQFLQAIYPLLSAKKSVCLLNLSEAPDILRLQIHNLLGMECFPLLDEMLLNGDAGGVNLEKVAHLALPQKSRWWNIGASVPAPRAKESYTSLSSCVMTPHEYALNYTARLSQGSLQTLPMDARLLGNLAHQIIEKWFASHAWSPTAGLALKIDEWIDEHLESFIKKYALTLSAPGNRVEKLRFASQIKQAMKNLVTHLESAGVKSVLVEQYLKEQLGDTTLNGTIDLLCKLQDDRWAIIDLKWGGQRRYEMELREGRYLQLATYARLVQAMHPSQIAEVAYLIMQSGDLIARSHNVFPMAKVIEPNDRSAMPIQVWNAFELTWQWRIQQLGKGMVEVTYSGEESTEDSGPGERALPVLEIEAASNKGKRSGYAQFKSINKWRVLLGQLEG